jgi:hypothetical protein
MGSEYDWEAALEPAASLELVDHKPYVFFLKIYMAFSCGGNKVYEASSGSL